MVIHPKDWNSNTFTPDVWDIYDNNKNVWVSSQILLFLQWLHTGLKANYLTPLHINAGYVFFSFYTVKEIEPRVFHMIGRHSTFMLYLESQWLIFKWSYSPLYILLWTASGSSHKDVTISTIRTKINISSCCDCRGLRCNGKIRRCLFSLPLLEGWHHIILDQ